MANVERKPDGQQGASSHGSTENHGTAEPTIDSNGAEPAAATGLFERVAVVTDETAAGRAAAETGLVVAQAHGADVDALYVVDTTREWDILVERQEDSGEAAVDEVAARGAELGVDVERWFRYGNDHEEVLDFANAHDADLIVVGSAKPTGVERVLNPETLPARVQRRADVPVLIVGPDEV